MSVRAKMRCQTVDYGFESPYEVRRDQRGDTEPTLPRTYKFSAVYDLTGETPVVSLEIHVDNPNVVFEPGKSYYLDFTPVD